MLFQRYRAVVFDMDGVLADTREWVVSAFHHTARTHGFSVTDEALHALFGQPLETCYGCLVPHADPGPLTGTHRAFQAANPHLVRGFDEVLAVLTALRDAGLRLGIVTGRHHTSAQATLDRLGLTPFFPVLVGADDAPRHKPDPLPLQVALGRLGVAPERALMVGDAAADILCGQRAGCDTAGALYGFTGPSLASAEPTYLLHAPSDLLAVVGLAAPREGGDG